MTKGRSAGRAVNLVALGVLAGLFALAHAPLAFAAKPRVGLSLNGASKGPVRETISAILRHHGYEVIETDLGDGSDEATSTAMKRERLTAAVTGEVREGKRLKLQVRGAAGDVLGAASWDKGGTKKLAALVGRTLWARLGGALTRASGGSSGARSSEASSAEDDSSAEPPANDATPKPSKGLDDAEASPDAEAEAPRHHVERDPSAPTDAGAAPAGTALDLMAGVRILSRNLTWTPSGTKLGDFSLGTRLAFGLAGSWYPAASFRGDWLSNLGVGGWVEWAPGLASVTPNGARYPTTATDFEGDARYRLLFAGVGQLALVAGGGQQSFVFRSEGTANRNDIQNLPDVQYSYLRAGADARFTLPANLSVLVSAGYRYVLGAGNQNYLIQESAFVPHSTIVAFDVAAGLGYRFSSLLEARAGFDLRRYQITAGANDAMVTSATDQYTAFWLGLAVMLDGLTDSSGSK